MKSRMMDTAAPTERESSDRPFLGRLALLYGLLTLLMTFTLDRFWSANWDVQIITDAVRTLWDGGSPFDLYAHSRATWPWPFPYPPHAALLLVPFIGLADLLGGTSADYGPLVLIAIRIPPVLAEVAIAWLIHRILWRDTGERGIARLGAALWLFNPILFYHTAVQGHQESTWLLPVLLAYERLHRRGLAAIRSVIVLLVIAIALKQSAAIYALPVLIWLLTERRWGDLALFGGLFALLFGVVSLPWALYSSDFKALVFDEVRKMPVQVQSWQLWALTVERFRLSQTETTFPTVRFATPLILLAASAIGTWMRVRGRSWWAIGLAATLCFVLISQKVMAYHYPMVLPWLILFALRARRFRLLTAAWVGLSLLLLSPYFAPWGNPDHLVAYALLGTVASLGFLWLLWQAMVGDEGPHTATRPGDLAHAVALTQMGTLLALCIAVTCLAPPLQKALLSAVPSAPPATQLAVLGVLLGGLALLILAILPALSRGVARALALPLAEQRPMPWTPALVAGMILILPLGFTWFTMTTEVTAVVEKGLVAAWHLDGR